MATAYSSTGRPDAKAIVTRYASLLQRRQEIDQDINDICAYIQPQKAVIDRKVSAGVEGWTDGLYDMTAHDANIVLAAGLMGATTPTSSRWAALDYPGRFINGRPVSKTARTWYQQCTEEVMDEIGRSNFYTEIHETHLDRNSAGTGNVFFDEGKNAFVRFQSFHFGSYVIAENSEGNVDTVYREFTLTVRQAVEKFGLEALPPKWKECFRAGGPEAEKPIEFIHAVEPRIMRDPTQADPLNLPFASCYVCKNPEHIVQEGGYDELPYAVSRFYKWPGTVWGFGPGFVVLPVARQLNFIERQLDALAEKAAFPPVIVPSNLFSQVDSRAGGQTVADENFPQAWPREWQTAGRYDVGKDRVEMKQEFIRRAFHNDLFQMFAQIDRQMTAFEAMQRTNEKLDLLSPAFTRLTSELLSPIIMRVFRMKMRARALPLPPEELLVRGPGGMVGLREPRVVYTGKLALAIKAQENRAFIDLQQILAGPAQLDPSIMDNFDMDAAARGIALNIGFSSEWTRPEADVAQMRAIRAQQQAQAQAIAEAQGAAKAAKDIGDTDPDVRNRLAGMMTGEN